MRDPIIILYVQGSYLPGIRPFPAVRQSLAQKAFHAFEVYLRNSIVHALFTPSLQKTAGFL